MRAALVGAALVAVSLAAPQAAVAQPTGTGVEGLATTMAAVGRTDADREVRVVVSSTDPTGRPVTDVTALDAGDAPAFLRAAARRAGTTAVELDSVLHATGLPGSDPLRPLQWELRGLGGPALWALPGAADVTVAVVDSGVDADHPDLAGSVLPGYDLVSPGGDGSDDADGHGTHVAGVVTAGQGDGVGIAGLRPGTAVLPVRVLDAAGNGSAQDVADGIVLAVDAGADVVNLSLGGATRSPAVENAVQYALDQGVVVVVASGNARQKGDPVMHPASHPGVVAVGATGRNGLVAPYSSTTPNLAVVAPGTDILSTVPGSWALSSGTSMAAPHVSAVVAAMLAVDPTLTPAQVRSLLMSTATDVAPAGHDRASGAGLVQPLAALRSLGASPVAVPGVPTDSPGLPRDVDHDGRADLLAAAADGALLRYRADGAGGVLARQVVGGGWTSMDLITAAGDWDGDGHQDLIARRRSDAALVLFRGDGLGGWLGSRVIGTRWGGIDTLLAPSDWDGDGILDLVARRSSDAALVLYPGAGGGRFAAPRQIGARWGAFTALVVLGDWDADGAPDLGARDSTGRLHLYPGDGQGGFGVPTVIGAGWSSIRALVGPGDWDGDDRPDLVTVLSTGALRIYRSDGRGGFEPAPRTFGTGWSSLRLAT